MSVNTVTRSNPLATRKHDFREREGILFMPKQNLNKQDGLEVEDAAGPDLPEQIVEVGGITQMEFYVLVAASHVPLCRGTDNWWRPVSRPDVAFPPCIIEHLLEEGALRPIVPGGRHQHQALQDVERVGIVETSAAGRRSAT
jgi:hypothetical protein